MLDISKITLGTVQMGIDYGIANKNGKPDLISAFEILEYALNQGINTFDTSPSYGNSEDIIGSFIAKQRESSNFKLPNIVTKIPRIGDEKTYTFQEIYNIIQSSLSNSVKHLKIDKVPICLMHHAPDMENCCGNVTKAFIHAKEEGLVEYIGVSVYSTEEIITFLEKDVFDVIQIPINLFDCNLIKSGLLSELANRKIKIFARSVFLQGLFFLDYNNLPSTMKSAKEPLQQLNILATETGNTIAELAVAFVRDLPWITSIIFGVETRGQLIENMKLIDTPPLTRATLDMIKETFSYLPKEVINPSYWGN